MTCSNCNNIIVLDAKFCNNCGTALADIPAKIHDVISGAAVVMNSTTTPSSSDMNYFKLLFSLKGRISRSTYWLKLTIPIIAISIILKIIDPVLGTIIVLDPYNGIYIGILSMLFSLLLIYPAFAITVKRIHDRGRSGWFMLILFVPFLGVWPLIEICFLKGTTGTNQYGEDPLS